MSIFAMLLQDGRLSVREILADIPHDLPAMLVYSLLALFIGFIWWGSRTRGGSLGEGDRGGRSGHVPPTAERRND